MARTGRGWDAKPPQSRAARGTRRGSDQFPENGTPLPDGSVEDEARRPGRRGGWQQAGSRGPTEAREQPPRDPHELAREICLRQLAVRPRTRAELAKALSRRGIAGDVAAAVLDRYDEVGMIDDAAFAKAWVSSRHHGRGLASRALAQELKQRGVSQEDASEALSELDSETEAQTALALAMRKLRTMHGEPEAVFRRLAAMLARKGYPGGVAIRAVKEALATRDAELAEQIDPDTFEEE